MNRPWILILGSNSDIGCAIAEKYAAQGFNLYLASKNYQKCEENAANIRIRYSCEALPIKFDATELDSHADFPKKLMTFPAGVIVAFGAMYDQKTAQEDYRMFKDMVDVNYLGLMSILEVMTKGLEKRGSGFIVAISSVAGDRGRLSNYLYGSTKAAVNVYIAGLRHRLSSFGVKVILIKPGFVETKMTRHLKLPRFLTSSASQVAEVVYMSVEKNKYESYVSPIWTFIMLIVRFTPNIIFHKTKL